MRTVRRVGGLALAGFLLTSVVGGPAASAQTEVKSAETYIGTAAGQALVLAVGSESLTAGATSVGLDSTLKAVAEGAGFLSPLGNSTTGKLEVVGNGATKGSTEQTCAASPIPAPLSDVLSLGAGCAAALAEVKDSLPHALATGKIAKLDVNLATVAATAGITVEELALILDPVLGGVGLLQDALETNLGTSVPLTEQITQLVDALIETKTLEVTIGDSLSETIVDGSKVTSIAKSEAGSVKLFPVGAVLETATGIELKPIVEIIVGSASATAVYDRATGVSTPSFDPAIVTIRVNTPLVDQFGQVGDFDLNEFTINPGLTPEALLDALPVDVSAATDLVVTPCDDAPNEFCVLEGTALETRIAVASGRTVTNADGSVGAVADAVKIHALTRIADLVSTPLDGGIKLQLAHAEAGVGGKPAELTTVTVPTVAPPELPRELPRTGGTPWLPIAAIAGAGLALAVRRLNRASA